MYGLGGSFVVIQSAIPPIVFSQKETDMFTYVGNIAWKKTDKHAAGKLPFKVQAKNSKEARAKARRIVAAKAANTGAKIEFNDKVESKSK